MKIISPRSFSVFSLLLIQFIAVAQIKTAAGNRLLEEAEMLLLNRTPKTKQITVSVKSHEGSESETRFIFLNDSLVKQINGKDTSHLLLISGVIFPYDIISKTPEGFDGYEADSAGYRIFRTKKAYGDGFVTTRTVTRYDAKVKELIVAGRTPDEIYSYRKTGDTLIVINSFRANSGMVAPDQTLITRSRFNASGTLKTDSVIKLIYENSVVRNRSVKLHRIEYKFDKRKRIVSVVRKQLDAEKKEVVRTDVMRVAYAGG